MLILTILSLAVLILVHELGHFLMAKFFKVKVEEFGIGFPPRIFKKKGKETIYSLNLLPLGGFVKIFGEEAVNLNNLSKEEESRAFFKKTFFEKTLVVLAGVLMNFIFGWWLLSLVFFIGAPSYLSIIEVYPNSPAALVGLKPNDLIFEVKVENQVLKNPRGEDFINFVKQAEQKPINLKVKRDKETLDLTLIRRINPPPEEGMLGISFVDLGIAPQSLLKSVVKGFEYSLNLAWLIFKGIFYLLYQAFQGEKVLEMVTGPVGIFVLISQAGDLGISFLLRFIALVSINLAVLNLIPFPALDGGRFLILLIEKIKGSDFSLKFQYTEIYTKTHSHSQINS